jgi:hypothetical protein
MSSFSEFQFPVLHDLPLGAGVILHRRAPALSLGPGDGVERLFASVVAEGNTKTFLKLV